MPKGESMTGIALSVTIAVLVVIITLYVGGTIYDELPLEAGNTSNLTFNCTSLAAGQTSSNGGCNDTALPPVSGGSDASQYITTFYVRNWTSTSIGDPSADAVAATDFHLYSANGTLACMNTTTLACSGVNNSLNASTGYIAYNYMQRDPTHVDVWSTINTGITLLAVGFIVAAAVFILRLVMRGLGGGRYD